MFLILDKIFTKLRSDYREGGYHYSICTLNSRKCQIVCGICESEGVIIHRISKAYDKGEDLLVIENIPVISWSHCGESYFTADTLHEIERIKLNRKTLAVERPVEVASFA